MRIVVLKDMPSIGARGDIKEVKNGFARNLLIPKKLARHATTEDLRLHQAVLTARASRAQAKLQEEKNLSERLKDLSITIPLKTSEKGTGYGSVSKEMIVEAIRAQHDITVDQELLVLAHPIKETGEHRVPLEFAHAPSVSITVNVTPHT